MPTTRQNITAIAYDKRGRILAIGKNSYTKTHTLQSHYATKVGQPAKVFLHAEIDALIRARGRSIHRILVLRSTAQGFGNAKPCAVCALALQEFGVQVVEYSQ